MENMRCQNCETERPNPMFVWKTAQIYKDATTKQQGDFVAICCAFCGRTLTVIPKPSDFE